MDNQRLQQLVTDSPLTPEEKEHWNRLIPTLTEDQKKQLDHILSTKIEVNSAIELIQKSLDIIAEAEAEAEYESDTDTAPANNTPATGIPPVPTQEELNKQIEEKTGEQSPFTEEKLVQMHTETKQHLEDLRQELHNLSAQATQQQPQPMQ